MAVTIAPNSAKLHVSINPTVEDPDTDGDKMAFTSTLIEALGEVTLLGDPHDSAVGWRVGFIQVQWIETNWCAYKGQTNRDGSIFIQRARPPARPTQACRDCVKDSPVNHIWYSELPADGEVTSGSSTSTFPLRLAVRHSDTPNETCALVEQNYRTGQLNFLSEAQFEFHFCTILTVQDPWLKFHHQKSFYWNTRWQATFKPANYTNPPDDWEIHANARESQANVGSVFWGGPLDTRFTDVITSPQAMSCNDVVKLAKGIILPGTTNRHESNVWDSWDVRKP